jgi:hypothetical protein
MPTHLRLHFGRIRFYFAGCAAAKRANFVTPYSGIDEDLGPGTASGANCNIKATPAADSTSCKDDAVVTMAESDNILTVRREGRAELTLASNPHDPVGDIEIVQLDCFLRGRRLDRARPGDRADSQGCVLPLSTRPYGRLVAARHGRPLLTSSIGPEAPCRRPGRAKTTCVGRSSQGPLLMRA